MNVQEKAYQRENEEEEAFELVVLDIHFLSPYVHDATLVALIVQESGIDQLD